MLGKQGEREEGGEVRRVREGRRREGGRGEDGRRREGPREGERQGEGLGLEIVPVIRKILLQAILAARAAGSEGGWWEGNLGGGISREGACECGGQGNHRLLTDEDARPRMKEA